MTYKDSFQLEITSENNEIIEGFNQFCLEVLRYGNNGKLLFDLADNDSNCALINSLSSIFCSLAETNLRLDLATHYYNRAKNSPYVINEKITSREKLYLSIAENLLHRNRTEVFNLFEEIVKNYPTDLLASKMLQIQYFDLGEKKNLCRVAEFSLEHNPNNHFIQGMTAFGLVETGDYERAERLGRQAVQLAPEGNDPWAQHAVAHCLDMKGRVEEGIQWMESFSSTWNNCCPFMYSHNWWHTCLFYLDSDNFQKVFDIYDHHVWNQYKDDVQCQAGAVSLLWRCDIRKIPIINRWDDIVDYIRPHIHDHLRPFLDIHYLYALAKTGDNERVEEMFQAIESESYFTPSEIELTKQCGKAVVYYARGQFQESCQEIEKVCPRLSEIGGSNAQIDVFKQTYIDSLIQTQQYRQALDFLIPRSIERPNTPYIKKEICKLQEFLK